MSGEAIGILIGAIGTFIGAVVLAYRGLSGDRFQRKVTESAALLTGYTEMVANLRLEIQQIRDDNEREMSRARKRATVETENLTFLHNEERARWEEERARLEGRIDTLEAQVAALLYNPPSKASVTSAE